MQADAARLQPLVDGVQPQTKYEYDANRNRTKQIDANTHVVRMKYDWLNRLDLYVQETGGPELVTDHDYDADGNETLLTDPKGQTVTSTYDELKRLKTKAYAFGPGAVERPWRHTTGIRYGYDENSNLTRIEESVASGTDPPATTLTTDRGHDLLDRLTTETTTLPDGGTRSVSYSYYGSGTRKTLTDADNRTTFYAYDGQNRLASATTDHDMCGYSRSVRT